MINSRYLSEFHVDDGKSIRVIRIIDGKYFVCALENKKLIQMKIRDNIAKIPENDGEQPYSVMQEGFRTTSIEAVDNNKKRGMFCGTEEGYILYFSSSGDVIPISMNFTPNKSLKNRISALRYSDKHNTLFAGNWNANLIILPECSLAKVQIIQFGTFLATPGDLSSVKENNVLAIDIYEDLLIVGLANGETKVYFISYAYNDSRRLINQSTLTLVELVTYKMHSAPVRAVSFICDRTEKHNMFTIPPFVSTGNDGRVMLYTPLDVLTNYIKSSAKETIVSTIYHVECINENTQSERLSAFNFYIRVFKMNNRLFFAIGGSGIGILIYDLERKKHLHTIPLFCDSWDLSLKVIEVTEKNGIKKEVACMVVALENGTLIQFCLYIAGDIEDINSIIVSNFIEEYEEEIHGYYLSEFIHTCSVDATTISGKQNAFITTKEAEKVSLDTIKFPMEKRTNYTPTDLSTAFAEYCDPKTVEGKVILGVVDGFPCGFLAYNGKWEQICTIQNTFVPEDKVTDVPLSGEFIRKTVIDPKKNQKWDMRFKIYAHDDKGYDYLYMDLDEDVYTATRRFLETGFATKNGAEPREYSEQIIEFLKQKIPNFCMDLKFTIEYCKYEATQEKKKENGKDNYIKLDIKPFSAISVIKKIMSGKLFNDTYVINREDFNNIDSDNKVTDANSLVWYKGCVALTVPKKPVSVKILKASIARIILPYLMRILDQAPTPNAALAYSACEGWIGTLNDDIVFSESELPLLNYLLEEYKNMKNYKEKGSVLCFICGLLYEYYGSIYELVTYKVIAHFLNSIFYDYSQIKTDCPLNSEYIPFLTFSSRYLAFILSNNLTCNQAITFIRENHSYEDESNKIMLDYSGEIIQNVKKIKIYAQQNSLSDIENDLGTFIDNYLKIESVDCMKRRLECAVNE